MGNRSDQRMRYVVGTVITFAWVVSIIFGLVTHDHNSTTLVTPLMIIYASYLYGDAIIKRRFPGEKAE